MKFIDKCVNCDKTYTNYHPEGDDFCSSLCKKEYAREEIKLKKETRASLNYFYMIMAEQFAERSKDPKVKVGAVIVTRDGILYPGYNGDEIGGTNERDSMSSGESGFLHAEDNAIIKFNPTIHKESVMYVTHLPCRVCARRIVNTQAIISVYYKNEYGEGSSLDIFKNAGVFCAKVS